MPHHCMHSELGLLSTQDFTRYYTHPATGIFTVVRLVPFDNTRVYDRTFTGGRRFSVGQSVSDMGPWSEVRGRMTGRN